MKWIVFLLMIAGLGYIFYISRDALERQLKSQSVSTQEATYNWTQEEEETSLESQVEATFETLQNP